MTIGVDNCGLWLYFAASDCGDSHNQEVTPEKTYICQTCGNTIVGRPPEECPICGASEKEFDVAR